MGIDAGVRFPGEFVSSLTVRTQDEFDLSCSHCHWGGNYRPVAVTQAA
jgi:hypothetical protein